MTFIHLSRSLFQQKFDMKTPSLHVLEKNFVSTYFAKNS